MFAWNFDDVKETRLKQLFMRLAKMGNFIITQSKRNKATFDANN